MTQDELRKEFESEFPVPKGAVFAIGQNEYCIHIEVIGDDEIEEKIFAYQHQWEGYQAATHKRDAEIFLLEEYIDALTNDKIGQTDELVKAEAEIAALKAELEAAKKDVQKLTALEVSGVDNWSGYDSAMDILDAMQSGTTESTQSEV